MRAVKGNKVYTIDETQKKFYEESGFDILDDAGKVVAYGRGKTIPYGDYEALKKENELLKQENDDLKEKLAAAQSSEVNQKQEEGDGKKTKTAKAGE